MNNIAHKQAVSRQACSWTDTETKK